MLPEVLHWVPLINRRPMGKKLFSDSLAEFTGEISNTSLSESITQLGSFLGKKKFKIFFSAVNNIPF